MAAASSLAIPALCRGGRFDVVFHAQWNTTHGSTIARRLGLVDRIVAAAHGRELLIGHPRPSLARAYDRWRRSLLHRIDRFVAVSRYTGRLLEHASIDASRIHVVPNGVDPHRFAPADGDAWRARHGLVGVPLLLTLCRLVPRKGIDTVLRALASVKARVPQVRSSSPATVRIASASRPSRPSSACATAFTSWVRSTTPMSPRASAPPTCS
jgi:phosphatidyl-myo-inositol dimannoside synthase